VNEVINQIFSIQLKSIKENTEIFNRNIDRIYRELNDLGYHIINPIGQKYTTGMTDVEASVSGDISDKMKIVKVLKPIIYKTDGERVLIQKGIVIVE